MADEMDEIPPMHPLPEREWRERKWDEVSPGVFFGLSFDEVMALEAAGQIILNCFAHYGFTREQVEYLAEHVEDPQRREALGRLIEAQRYLDEQFRAAFPVQVDLAVLMNDHSDQVRLEACDRLVDHIAWKLRGRQARDELCLRAREQGRAVDSVKRDELRAALVLAFARLGDDQRVRFGNQYVHDRDGKPAQIVPGNMKWEYVWRWLKAEAISIAEESLRGGVRTEGHQTLSREGDALDVLAVEEATARAGRDPLDVLLAREGLSEKFDKVIAVLFEASDQERELLLLMREGRSIKEAAEQMNIKPKRAYDLWERFKARLSA